MSYSNPNVELTYDGNGADQSFSVNFHYQEGDPVIQVELWDYSDPNVPTQSSFVEGVDYTIDESGYPNTVVNTTVAVPVNFKLLIYRSTTPIQTTSFVNGSFPAESVEEAIDKVAMIAQEVAATLDRAVLSPIGGPQYTYEEVQINATLADHEARITANKDQVDINTPAISANTAQVATNTADISTLQAQVSGLEPETVVSVTSGPAYAASDKEIVIVDTNDAVNISLPAPSLGDIIRVKFSEKIASKTITATSSIDGFGTTYTVLSEYESVSLVSDGANWYII